MQVIEIGKTEEGRPHLAAIITAPENFAKLDRYKQIAQQMHGARGISETQARALAKEGKAVVWIDGGLHATEVVGAHQLIETIYQLVSRTDEETHANPARRDHHGRARESRRHADGVEVLHAEHRSAAAPRPAARVSTTSTRVTTTTATSTCRT